MASALPYTLPPDFDVERLLDDIYPDRLLFRFRRAEGTDGAEAERAASVERIMAAVRASLPCRFCGITTRFSCDTCEGAA